MSSYHSKFIYLNKDSSEDLQLLVTHFSVDQGETDSYLSQEQVYTESYNGKKRILYGTKWNAVATIKITVIKQNRSDFSVAECRNIYKWLTGNPSSNWLDLYAGDKLQYSFLCTCQDVKPEKLDARTIGLNIYFESVSPWAYSPQQTLECYFGQDLFVDNSGVLSKGDGDEPLGVTANGELYNDTSDGSRLLEVTSDGVFYIDNSVALQINNLSDDLYTYITLETTLLNQNSDYVSIKNTTLDEECIITGMSVNEKITLSANQFIVSDINGKTFGNSFNFVWPRLAPGINNIVVSGTGSGSLEFTYRYPIKIGDCVIDVYVPNTKCGCPDNTDYGIISWSDIAETPTTVAGYGITDVYTDTEVNDKLNNICVDENELNDMLTNVLTQ